MFIIFTLLLTGCVGVEKEKPPSNAKITIEPYNMSEKESSLISKTGIEYIEFFKLEGTLKEEDDLQFAVELYENGKFKETLLNTSNEPKAKFKDSLISFGISNGWDNNSSLKLVTGTPSGLVTKNYSNNMTSSSFSTLVGKKITLEKNKPVYLAAWIGTTKHGLHSVDSKNGKLPEDIKEAEIAMLYRVLWTDNEKK